MEFCPTGSAGTEDVQWHRSPAVPELDIPVAGARKQLPGLA